eukprot:517384_1
MELDWTIDHAHTFKNNGETWGAPKAFNTKKFNNLDAMNIQCFVEETMEVSDENTYFEWTVSNYLLRKWKIAKGKDAFFSPKFDTIGAEWELKIFPNYKAEGRGHMCIRCTSIKTDEKEITYCHYIAIEALNHCQINFEGNTIKNDQGIVCDSPFKWNDIQNQHVITIGIKVWTTGSIESNEAR